MAIIIELGGYNYQTKNYNKHQIQLWTLSILVRVLESSNSLVSFSLNYQSFCLFSNYNVTIRAYQIRIRVV
jgi:hypothetical protein